MIGDININSIKELNLGLDAGSTTVKIVATAQCKSIIFKEYRRHYADISGTVISVLEMLQERFGNVRSRLTITGSAGMGVAKRSGIPFVQEVIASCKVVKDQFPETQTLIDIGGEDAKMIFFREGYSPDIRMNGSCAGGTGAFIDQMATLLDVNINELNLLAERSQTVYPIASRCGVFSKTDVQNLLSRNVSKEDIAASIFHATSLQVITSLARGFDISGKIFLCGGPFTFIPALRKAFEKLLKRNETKVVLSRNSEVVSAWGAAVLSSERQKSENIEEIIDHIKTNENNKADGRTYKIPQLFKNSEEKDKWLAEKRKFKLPVIDLSEIKDSSCFLGVDCGSTTTKIVAIDKEGKIFFKYYENNRGNPLKTVAEGLSKFVVSAQKNLINLQVMGSCVTGYGEDLIRKAFPIEYGIVETIAHYTAAYRFNPKVSFILDIGGQDIKAAFIENGAIRRLEINEACSSGCGSFIETFARSLNYSLDQFSEIAAGALNPYDLGTRCTVFMNSKVKQALREGTSVADIAAGLGYSVIKNCLNKVLKLKNTSTLGDHIMVQGGTFRNRAVLRSLELESGKNVMVTDFPELMGAYGAALFALNRNREKQVADVLLEEFSHKPVFKGKIDVCNGCENKCNVTEFIFDDDKRYFSGNKCEKIFSNRGSDELKGNNIYTEKYDLLFKVKSICDPKLKLGIPRALGIYENYPFWQTLFQSVGIQIVLSRKSTIKLYEKGINSVMADNICFPAKLTNGHIIDLMNKDIDRIFLPFVVHDKGDNDKTPNSYNCPIVTGYSEVIRSSVDPERANRIQFDSPTFTFRDEKLLKRGCIEYLKEILPELKTSQINLAFKKALAVQLEYEKYLALRCKEIYNKAIKENRPVILLAGRPYHSDPLIQHKISEIIAGFNVDVISEDIVRGDYYDTSAVNSVMQWAYTNRIIRSALFVSKAPLNVHYIELTSFGCGPDAFILDEVSDILSKEGKNATILKVDDINNVGSTRLRIRSLIESFKLKSEKANKINNGYSHTPSFLRTDRNRKILMPWFADIYSPFLPSLFSLIGYDAENLPPSDQLSAELGLKYSNNEVCYPATLVIGDFIKALTSGKYKHEEIALGITQTGGQCRASNYIALIKKAVVSAGYYDIPVISVSTSGKNGALNDQPGFSLPWKRMIKIVVSSLAYADSLSQLYFATAPRETTKGAAERLKNKYIQLGINAIESKSTKSFYSLLDNAVKEFSDINNHKDLPEIGIVGEIYVKYNNFGHRNIINWLISQEVQPVMPPLSDFFTSAFASRIAAKKGNISHNDGLGFIYNLFERYIFRIIKKMQSRVSSFKYFRPIQTPHHHAAKASEIINLNAQFGEGWGIPAEFAHFAETGVNNVVSLQPFGCIANHIISKGIEKKVRELYPALNILFLDFDSGMSEANIFNRLHFMIENAS